MTTLKDLKDAIADLTKQLTNFLSGKVTDETKSEFAGKLSAFGTRLDGELKERDDKIADLTGRLETAQNEVNAKGTEITNLKTDLDKEKKRTDETLASLGIDPKTIPPAPAPKANAKTKTRAEFEALSFSERNEFVRTGGKIK